MPRNEHSDSRYEVTRDDVLYALGPVPPRTDCGPDNPDPFGHNQRPWTESLIAWRIAYRHGLVCPHNRVGRVIKLNKMRELLERMATYGSIVGRTRAQWAAMGREAPSRAKDMLYAHPKLTCQWEQDDAVPRETPTRERHGLQRRQLGRDQFPPAPLAGEEESQRCGLWILAAQDSTTAAAGDQEPVPRGTRRGTRP